MRLFPATTTTPSRPQRTSRILLAAVLGLAAVGVASGCKSQKDQTASGYGLDRDGLAATDAPIEAGKQPEITAETRFAAGQVAESQGAPQRAIEQYVEAIKLDPKHRDAVYRLAMVYTEMRMFNDAVDTWTKYVDCTDGAASAWSNLALCHELAGQPVEAEAAYRKGIEREANNKVCRTNFGLMLARQKRYQESADQLSAVMSEVEVHYDIASVLEQQGEIGKAKRVYRRALEIDPSFWEARARLDALEAPTVNPASAAQASVRE